MGKDEMEWYREWIQFPCNKIAEISLFVEMKYALAGVNPTMVTIIRFHPAVMAAATFNLSSFQYR